jgi:hypothetical protein
VSEELKPCPFCGGKPYRTVGGLVRCDGINRWQGGQTKPHDEILMDEQSWNTRATPNNDLPTGNDGGRG